MIYEIRTYEPHDGKANALVQRFRDHTLRLFPGHGIEILGLFSPVAANGQIVYLTRFVDDAARQTAWAAFGADPEWQRIKAATERDGPLLRQQTVSVMTALPAGLLLG